MKRGDLVTITDPDGTARHYIATDVATMTAGNLYGPRTTETTVDLLADPTEEDVR